MSLFRRRLYFRPSDGREAADIPTTAIPTMQWVRVRVRARLGVILVLVLGLWSGLEFGLGLGSGLGLELVLVAPFQKHFVEYELSE